MILAVYCNVLNIVNCSHIASNNPLQHERFTLTSIGQSALLLLPTIMNIRIQVRHEATRESIQKYIHSAFDELRLAHEIISAECIVDQEGTNGRLKTFEATLHVPGDTFAVRERADEAHIAVDAAMKVIEKLLLKHKETHQRPGSQIRHNIERSAKAEEREVTLDEA